MESVQFATIGTSMITGQFIEATTFVEGAKFCGAYSRDAEHAKSYTQEYEGLFSWSNIDEMLASSVVNAVYVASPNSLHAEQVKAALLAGKHVLCEKPLAPYFHDVDELFTLAKKQNLILMEGMRPVHDPNYALLKSNLSQIGEVGGAYLRYCKHPNRYDELKRGKVPNIFNAHFATGAMSDLGIYPIEVALYLFGMPKELKSSSLLELPQDSDMSIDVAGAAIFDYGSFLCSISYSKVANDTTPCAVYGTNDELFWQDVAQPERMWKASGNEILLAERLNKTNHVVGNMEYELRDFVEAVQTHTPTKEANHITLSAVRILEEMRCQGNIRFKE